MGYAEALEMARESLTAEEMEKAISELPSYHTKTEIVTMTIKGEMYTPDILIGFAYFAECVIENVPGAFLEGTTVYVPQSREEMERHVVSNLYYKDKEKWDAMAE